MSFLRTPVVVSDESRLPIAPRRTTRTIGAVRWLLPIVATVVLVFPAAVFFTARGGLSFFRGADLTTFSLKIFPLVGLYAFTLLWLQLMIGASMDSLRRVYGWIETWHRRQGVFVFLFAWTHPMLLLIGVGPTAYLAKTYVAPSLVPFVWLGYVQLTLLNLTAVTALLRRRPWFKRHWHTIHFLNYLTFVLIWIHSWSLGSDVQHSALRWLWLVFAAGAVAATIGRIARRRPRATPLLTDPKASPTIKGMEEQGFVAVATTDQVKEGQPWCATVNGQQIAVFKFGDSHYAIDNSCSHAGGSLCQGIQTGQTIECPLHQSVFDITTGAVKEGPAVRPQRTYRLRVRGKIIEIQL